jgi:radical SAM protein with 4Fe4S-binding SPASM domain
MAHYNSRQLSIIHDPSIARDVFKASVARIEIETHSYCNRRCGYCPNVTGDRLKPNERMREDRFAKIVKDLGDIAYDGILVLNSYNEPLYDRMILDRIRKLANAAPKASIEVYTNGDYLTPTYIEELASAGLRKIHISIHMNAADIYSDEYAHKRIEEVASRTGITPRYRLSRPLEFMIADLLHPTLAIEARAVNYWKHGQNRGELIKSIKSEFVRTTPCHFPFYHFIIGYNGNIVPCCHFRADREEHSDYVIGNIDDFSSLFLAYTCAAAVRWRQSLVGFGEKEAPCKSCDVAFLDGKLETMVRYKGIVQSTFPDVAVQAPL